MAELQRRSSLVWNFDDNNFTWMDASVVNGAELSDTICVQYGFDAGWQATWQDLLGKTVDWATGGSGTSNLTDASDPWGVLAGASTTAWDDFYDAGDEQNLYYLTEDGVWKADQVIDKTGVKDYFAERTRIDFDDVVPDWRSNNYKYAKQIFFHLQSPTGTLGPNSFEFQVGGGNNLMDPPEYQDAQTLSLLDTTTGGRHKIDFRATWRYHAMKWDFTLTDEIAMTGVDIDVEEAHGR